MSELTVEELRRERRLESKRRYRERHREELREQARRYYESHREQVREQIRLYQESHREEVRAWGRQATARGRRQLRNVVLDHYGRVCACCGTTDQLTIDHVNGDGGHHRMELSGTSRGAASTTMYRWLIRNGFPPGFQTLCNPCNNSKGGGPACRLTHTAAAKVLPVAVITGKVVPAPVTGKVVRCR